MRQILLDSQSACEVIINPKLLSNVSHCGWTLILQTQAVHCIIDQVGKLNGVGTPWCYPKGLANALSQCRISS